VLAGQLGIGNSTGLGMAPYIINHPVLFNNWIAARETAIQRVRDLDEATPEQIAAFRALFARSVQLVGQWRSEHPVQVEKLAALSGDLEVLTAHLDGPCFEGAKPWDRLMTWSETHLGEEGQELLASLILEPYGDLVDDLGMSMCDSAPAAFHVDGTMSVAEVTARIRNSFGWALDLDWSDPRNCARAWYVSEEKLEPRLGERFEEPIAEYEQPLAPARDAAKAHAALKDWDPQAPIAAFLAKHPEHRHTVRRAQISAHAPYGEIRSNTIAADVMPIDMLRAKLSFFGVTRFDPRSDRWVRVNMYAGAPYPQDLSPDNADLWVYPEVSA
jgi:hypothetical protein